MTNQVPTSVDYTNRDYYALRSVLISRIQNNFQGTGKQWAGTDPADFGVALVESFAYMGDIFNYYIDRLANENYITTATQRQSIINLANNYGYSVSGYRAATTKFNITNNLQSLTASVTNAVSASGFITFTANNTFTAGQTVSVVNLSSTAFNVTDAVIVSRTATQFVVAGSASGTYTSTGTATVSNLLSLPSGTQFALSIPSDTSTVTVYFTTTSLASISAGDSALISAINGRYANTLTGNDSTYGEQVTSNAGIAGQPNQRYKLISNQIVDGTITVYLQKGGVYEQWSEAIHLVDYGPTDAVYSVELDAQNNVYLNFGDGISGAIPTPNAIIWANYLIGGGTFGNIGQNVGSPTISYIPGITDSSTLGFYASSLGLVNTTQASGGFDPESNDSIRANAPLALRALRRAVTLEDFASLSLAVPNVGKSKAVALSPNSVTLYVGLQQNDASGDATPGYSGGSLTQAWYDIQSNVSTYLADKIQIGTTLTVAPPIFIPVKIDIKYTKLPQYTDAEVQLNLKLALINGFSYNLMNFKDVVTPEEIEQTLGQAVGVNTVKVINQYRYGSTAARTTLIGAANEIFSYIESNTTISSYSSSANLTALSITNGTLSPTFSSTFYNYNFAVTSGSSSVSVTPTLTGASNITVNGTTVASGASTSVTTAIGTTTITIVVTAEDGFSNTTYTVTATRVS